MVLLACSALLTIVGTLFSRRPLLSAVSVSILVSLAVGLPTMRTDAFWILATGIILVVSLPVTIVTAIVSENLMDKYAPHWRG
jgi:preprotein translocase subunit SecY